MRFVTMIYLLSLTACSDVEEDSHDHHDHDHELMTTVTLTLTSGDETMTVAWADPEQDGDPVIDTLTLTEGVVYDASLGFLNEAEEPAEDITPEILDEAEEHQVFVFGNAVEGPGTDANPDALVLHEYNDMDDNGLPIGLENTFEAVMMGSGELTIVLRHQPEEDGQAVKVEGQAADLAAEGLAAVGGASDIEVTFPVMVE